MSDSDIITPKEARRLWVAALRSSKYSQTKHVLHDDLGFCCLGVACEVFNELRPGVLDITKAPKSEDPSGLVHYDGYADTLPQEVMSFFSLASDNGSYKDDEGVGGSLAEDNDNGLTFSQIADIIESEPEGLVTR